MVSIISEFDWSKYIDLAGDLDNQAGTETDPQKKEALYRASISRAYYGAWCLARNRLKLQTDVAVQCPKPGGAKHQSDEDCLRDHGCVIHYYEVATDSAWRQIGQNLRNMMFNRKGADYDDAQKQRVSDLCREQVWYGQDVRDALRSL